MKKEVSFLISVMLIGAFIAVCWFALPLSGATDRGGQIVLKLGHGLDPSHPVHIAMEFMNERLQELSSGTVKIDIYPSSVLGSEVQCIEQLQYGLLAMTKTSTASIENFVSEMAV